MRDRREIVAEISVHYFASIVLRDVKVYPSYRRLCIHPRAKPVLLWQQVRFEDRTYYQHHSGLDYAVFYRLDAQRTLATIAFWNPHASKRLRSIALTLQFFLQRFEPLFFSRGLDRLEVDPVHTRRAGVGPAASICFS